VLVRNVAVAIFVASAGIAGVAAAQQPVVIGRPYDGIQAGLDAFRLAEEKRQVAVAQQLFLNDQMRFWNGYPTSRGETIYYGYPSPAAMYAYGFAAPSAPLANLDYAYAYGAGPLWGGFRRSWAGPLAVFQPWPYVPGDIYGYRAHYQPARQPIGQTQMQTGPNRWESHPVYDPPLTEYRPLPPVDSPLLDHTPYASPQVIFPPVETAPPELPARGNSAAPELAPPVPPGEAAPPRRGPVEI
jgi:hypothetical protein